MIFAYTTARFCFAKLVILHVRSRARPALRGRDRSGGEAVPERSGGMKVARSAYGTTDSPIFAERSETKSHPKNKKSKDETFSSTFYGLWSKK